MTGFGTVPILIIAGIVILSNLIITMVLLSKGSTAAKIIAANDKSPSEKPGGVYRKKENIKDNHINIKNKHLKRKK